MIDDYVEDIIVVSFVKGLNDIPTMVVARKEVNDVKVINIIRDKKAIKLYNSLTTIAVKDNVVLNAVNEAIKNMED